MRATPARPQRVRVMRQLRALVDGLQQSARAVEAHTGVTNAQLFLLRQVGAAGTLSVTELAERMGARQNSVSAVLRRVVSAGLVRRAPAADDARRAAVSLTPAGRTLLRRAPRPPVEQLLAAVDRLGLRELGGLAAGLDRLLAALDLSAEGDAPFLFEKDHA